MLSLSWQSLYYSLYYMQALGLDRATLVAGQGGGVAGGKLLTSGGF